ncbi:MAG: NADAR family protein [Chlamydiales bacterium]
MCFNIFNNNLPASYFYQSAEDEKVMEKMEALAEYPKFILFYDEEDPDTEWLGNFYPITVEIDGRSYPSSESAFQAQKFIHHPDLMDEFTNLSGEEAFYMARKNKTQIRNDWRKVNDIVMQMVLRAKLEQNPSIATWLEATGDAHLVEHNPKKGRDAYWSDNHDGTGKNKLGHLWMELRAEMRNEPVSSSEEGKENYLKYVERHIQNF